MVLKSDTSVTQSPTLVREVILIINQDICLPIYICDQIKAPTNKGYLRPRYIELL